MATIREIADLAGVSRGTVDRVLNKRGRVRPDTEKRVKDILHKLDYQLNGPARALSMQKRKFKIAYIYDKSENNTFFDDIVTGINAKVSELHRYNIKLIIKPVGLYDTRLFLQAIHEMQRKKVDGLIISPFSDTQIAIKINELVEKGFPVVTCNTDSADSKRLAFVGPNYYKMGFTAGGLMGLIVSGKAQIGIVRADSREWEWRKGFIDAVTKNHPDIHIVSTIEAKEDINKVFNEIKKMMKKNPGIQAILAETVAVYGVCRALTDMGLEKKVKVICYDDMPERRNLMKEGLVSAIVIQNPFWQGYRSFEILWDYLLNRKLPDKEINYSVNEIRVRESLEEL